MRMMLAQLNYTIGDFAGNTEKIITALKRAQKEGVDLVLFSELAICGYPPEDLLFHQAFLQEMERCLQNIVAASEGLFVVVGIARKNPSSTGKPLLNSAAIIQSGKLVGYQDKWLLPTYDVFDERRYFEPGRALHTWQWKGKKIAVTVCEDIWQHAGYGSYAQDPVQELVGHKVDLMLNLSASPYQFQKPSMRIKVCAKAARSLHCPVLLCCQVGGNDQLVFDGYSLFVDEQGELIALGKGFQEEVKIVSLGQKKEERPLCDHPIEEVYSALVLGVRDYFHKSGFHRGCLGLSGGIDSAVVACIAAEALGPDQVLALSMPSRYSSASSLTDAKDLAKNLGVLYQEVPVDRLFSSCLSLLTPYFAGHPEDVTEENLQARIRGMILMAFSNKLGYVVLSTGNKSEMALGYCTLYGDMCGGLSVISDVAKGQVYELARYINRDKEIIPLSTLTKPPSAELKEGQKDSDSLPDYAIVDKILHLYVEEGMSVEEICLQEHLALPLVQDLVQRIHRAEYKRRQAAPGIRVSKKAFRIGRMYPIVQKWK